MDTRIGGRGIAGWVLLSTVTWAVASLAGFVLVGGVVAALWGDPDEVLDGPGGFAAGLGTVFLLAGAATGAVQAWLLRRRGATGVARWALGSGLGFAVVAVGFALLDPLLPLVVNELLHNVAAGVVAGSIQAGVLRASGIPLRLRTWVGWSCAAYLTGATVNLVLARLVGGREDISGIGGVAALSLVLAVGLGRLAHPRPVMVPAVAVRAQ